MRTAKHIDQFRLTPEKDNRFGSTPDIGMNGVFFIPYAEDPRIQFKCIASDGSDPEAVRLKIEWEHVSICARSKNAAGRNYERVPNWAEMCWLKDLFFLPEECVVQFHPKRSEYVNTHPNVLHLWKWKGGEFPTPPTVCV